MSYSDLTSILLILLLLVGLVQLLGWIFVRLRHPKVITEILTGSDGTRKRGLLRDRFL